jgi:hypothetical protein
LRFDKLAHGESWSQFAPSLPPCPHCRVITRFLAIHPIAQLLVTVQVAVNRLGRSIAPRSQPAVAELGLANAQRTAARTKKAAKASEMAGQEIDRKLK